MATWVASPVWTAAKVPTVALANSLFGAGGNLDHAAHALFDHITPAQNSGSAETDLFNDSIAAGQWAANGDCVQLRYVCNTANNANAKTIRLYIAGTIVSAQAQTVSVANSLLYDFHIMRVSATALLVSGIMIQNAAPAVIISQLSGLTLSNAQIVKITGQGIASNDITCFGGKLNFIPTVL